MGTGRMPMAGPMVQAPGGARSSSPTSEIAALGAYVASLAPGPEVPSEEAVDPTKGDPAKGGELFRVNCAMCHNFAGAGGALTRGKYAPAIDDVTGKHIYEAMVTGPQSMPVFNDTNLTPESKRDIIAFLTHHRRAGEPGRHDAGLPGPGQRRAVRLGLRPRASSSAAPSGSAPSRPSPTPVPTRTSTRRSVPR